MDPSFLFKGIAIGFSIAAPVGPIGVLCIRRSLSEGFSCGFLCGMVVGVFMGSAAWWLTLSGVVSFLRAKINTRAMKAVNALSGAIIFTFGILTLKSIF